MSTNPYAAPSASLKSNDPLPWHRRFVSVIVALSGMLTLIPAVILLDDQFSPITNRLSIGSLLAFISVASFVACFMIRKFHRYAWLPVAAAVLALGVPCVYFWHGIADGLLGITWMAVVASCALYAFLTRNAKPRSAFSS